MAELYEEIKSWLHDQADWFQEGAERLLSKEELDQADITGLAAYVKTEDGQKKTNHRTFTGLSQKGADKQELRLKSIGDIQGIENLSPRTPLNFGTGNLSVIYGHNGSGKSGYARIIKKVCGNPRAEALKPNVFEDPPAEQKCTIEYQVEEKNEPVEWQANAQPISELEFVDIFDGDEAGFYLNKETEVSYTPREVALFEKLASVCEKVKDKLQEEQDQLTSSLPKLPDEYLNTEKAKKYNNLKAGQSEEDLAEILIWKEDEHQKQLDQIKERLKSDPSQLARTKSSKKQQLDQTIEKIKSAIGLVDKNGCQKLQELKNTAIDKRKVATEGAKAQTASTQFDGIGSQTWNAMWEAAREYSTKVAYPDKEFPLTEEGSRCVLCHQELNPDAQQRLQDFEQYVQGKLEREAKQAEQDFKEALEKLPRIPTESDLKTAGEAAGLEEEWLPKLNEIWQQVQKVSKNLQKKDLTEDVVGVPYPTEMFKTLEERSKTLADQIEQHKADAKDFDKEKIDKQRLELEAKKWTSQQRNAIKAELDRLKKQNQYEDWKKKANPRSTSLKAGEISKKAITQEYVSRFKQELENLGAKRIQVELVKTRTERGRSKHQIRLCNVRNGEPELKAVLSDGERRIVALAAFLADVTGRPESAPFIFDDPISSLDHEFEWEVAMRLATLAQERQVIVLTHRLSLYGVLEDAAKKLEDKWKDKNLEQHCIESLGNSVGHPASEQAWTQKTDKANNTLIDRLDKAKKELDNGGEIDIYKSRVKSICTDFRKLLERSVEDDLLNAVVKRHRKSITTDNRLGKLQNINNQDCEFLDRLMTKFSKFEHSRSEEHPVDIPDEQDLRKDLEDLNEWRKSFKERAKSINN